MSPAAACVAIRLPNDRAGIVRMAEDGHVPGSPELHASSGGSRRAIVERSDRRARAEASASAPKPLA
jgi:hypothetical protein